MQKYFSRLEFKMIIYPHHYNSKIALNLSNSITFFIYQWKTFIAITINFEIVEYHHISFKEARRCIQITSVINLQTWHLAGLCSNYPQWAQISIYHNHLFNRKICHMFDFSIIGGGIVGGMITRALAQRYPAKRILLVEKESALGMHTSTRNSAVLHAGFYYSTDSIKAKLCREGNRALTQYCKENGVTLKPTGKFLVARNDAENERLAEIKRQGDINNVELELMSAKQALSIEPHLKVHNPGYQFLYSPTTSVADNKGIMRSIHSELSQSQNVTVLLNSQYDNLLAKGNGEVRFRIYNSGKPQVVSARYLINSAGLYADVVAKQFGFCSDYAIWPFKGNYLITNDEGVKRVPQARALIYPVPPLKGNYFLGIHTTLTTEGHFKIGPSISPAFWREGYTWRENFVFSEFLEIMKLNVKNTLSPDMRHYMESLFQELKKINRKYMLKEAMKLTTQLDGMDLNELLGCFKKGRPGIRSQLYNLQTKKMVQDFIFEHDDHSLHLLNVASPGWTCSIPMAEHICNLIQQYKI